MRGIPREIGRLRFVVRRRPRRDLPPGAGDILPIAFRYSRNQLEFEAPPVVQTPCAELIAGHRRPLPDRLDQSTNPDGDTAEEPTLFDRQFVQIPIACLVPVHLYSMPDGGERGQALARDSARKPISERIAAPCRYVSGTAGWFVCKAADDLIGL